MTSIRVAARHGKARPASIALACLMLLFSGSPSGSFAQSPSPQVDTFRFDGVEFRVAQIQQMSVVIRTPEGILYTDPTGGAQRYSGLPAPDIILVSHEHHEHYEAETLRDLMTPTTRIVVPPFVMNQLPSDLRSNAVQLANGDALDIGAMRIEAIGAYGLSGAAAQWHPQGRGNGYVVTVAGQRIYVAGSTEEVPEMLALENVNLAFLPLYPPYALGPEGAVQAISSMRPEIAYIYQYNSVGTRDGFVGLMSGTDLPTTIVANDISNAYTASPFTQGF